MHVLITGAAGLIGRHLSAALEAEHTLRLADTKPLSDCRSWVEMDVTCPGEVRQAMQGVDAVVHLAIASGFEGAVEDEDFNQFRFDVNVKGTRNVLESARREGVQRVVYTSSLMVVWGYEPPQMVASDAVPRPVGTYALTKLLGEVVCEQYARQFEMSIVCLRIAKPIDTDDEYWKQNPIRPQFIAFPDLVEAYRLAIIAPNIDFEIITLVGESSKRRWDLEKAKRVLGYLPKHRLEDEGFRLGEEREPLPEEK